MKAEVRIVDRGSKTWIKVKNPKAPAATRAIDGTFKVDPGVISGMDSSHRLVLFGLIAIGVAFALALTFYYVPQVARVPDNSLPEVINPKDCRASENYRK